MGRGASRIRDAAVRNRHLVGLPPRVSVFYARARRLAARRGDHWSLHSVTKPPALRTLIELAGDRRSVVEVGTGTGWTAAALAIADPRRQVVSLDPVARPERDWYLSLCSDAVRRRVAFVEGPGEHGIEPAPQRVEMLYIDGSHDRDGTIATFRAWSRHLAHDAVVAFHDWCNPDYPGVAEAIQALGLDGEGVGEIYVWRAR